MAAEHGGPDVECCAQLQPCCSCAVVFCPIPLLTWLFPCIGHVGICSSDGTTFDFAGPYTVNVGCLLFGAPTRYLPLSPQRAQQLSLQQAQGATQDELWDEAVLHTARTYQNRNYNMLAHNCHHMVVHFLNGVCYEDRADWAIIHLAAWLFASARYVGPWQGILKTWLPFCIVMVLGICIGGAGFLIGYAAAFGVLVGWFAVHTLCRKRRGWAARQPETVPCSL